MVDSDAVLVAQARAGDRRALALLFERHRPRLLHLTGRLLDDAAEAEDVAQEACLQAYLTLERLRDSARFGAWLAGIALNLARMRLRRPRAAALPEDWDGGRLAAGFSLLDLRSAEAACQAREQHAAVVRAIASLPAEQQSAVRLHYFDGLSLADVAALTDVPAGSVKARLHRARHRLQLLLSPSLGRERQPPDTRSTKEPGMVEVLVNRVVLQSGGAQDATQAVPAQTGPEAAPPPAPPAADRRVVLLEERGGERVLPIWIGPWEGDSIALLLAGVVAPRPLTHELMGRLLEVGQVKLKRATITRLHEEVFYATLDVQAGGQAEAVDARPSDAIALALRMKAPLYVDEAVLETAGVGPADAPRGDAIDAAAMMAGWPVQSQPPVEKE